MLLAVDCLQQKRHGSPYQTLKSGHLYVGRPAKAIRELNDKELSYFKYTAANYVKLKDEYLAEQ